MSQSPVHLDTVIKHYAIKKNKLQYVRVTQEGMSATNMLATIM